MTKRNEPTLAEFVELATGRPVTPMAKALMETSGSLAIHCPRRPDKFRDMAVSMLSFTLSGQAVRYVADDEDTAKGFLRMAAELASCAVSPDVARVEVHDAVQAGRPGVRDVDAPCPVYEPGTPAGDCVGDGHYLCSGCQAMDPGGEP